MPSYLPNISLTIPLFSTFVCHFILGVSLTKEIYDFSSLSNLPFIYFGFLLFFISFFHLAFLTFTGSIKIFVVAPLFPLPVRKTRNQLRFSSAAWNRNSKISSLKTWALFFLSKRSLARVSPHQSVIPGLEWRLHWLQESSHLSSFCSMVLTK